MDLRTVIQIKNSLFICIPQEAAENLSIKKSDRCEIILLPGYGVLVRKEGNGSKYPIPQEAEHQAQRAAREAYEETKRKIRAMAAGQLEYLGKAVAGRIAGKLMGYLSCEVKIMREEFFRGEAAQKRLVAEATPGKGKEKSGATLINKIGGRTKPKRAKERR